ncbi:MAG: phosphoribosyltransferase [Burkholderiaceae bacterium]
MLGDSPPFKDRRDAGLQLASALMYLKKDRPVILALPRGGVPVAYEVAHELMAPLDVLVVRKIGAPGYAELGIGAVVDGEHPQTVLHEDLIRQLNVPASYLAEETQRQLVEIERRRKCYCGDRPPLQVHGRTVIIVDDGIATGGTMAAALKAVAREGPEKLIFAVPVAARDSLDRLCREVDDGISLVVPPDFRAVGQFYRDFDQTEDEEVISLLERQYVGLRSNNSRTQSSAPARDPRT